MKSRMERYYEDNLEDLERTKKNIDLYKEVYGNYTALENLPVSENANEIDLKNLKTVVTSRNDYKKVKEFKTLLREEEIEEKKKNSFEKEKEELRIYDINQLLNQAKEENSKIKNNIKQPDKIKYNYLATLAENELTREEVVKSSEDLELMENNPIIDTKPTEKLEFPDIEEKEIISTASLPLDILVDLKPTENTVVSVPIIDKEEEQGKTFYSGSYTFSKKDFNKDIEFQLEEKKNKGLKIIFLIIGILIVLVITYCLLKHFNIINF